jgi:uncharacterized protein
MAPASQSRIEIADVPEAARFVIRVDDEEAGFAEYQQRPRGRAFVHTVVEDRFGGQGLAGRLVSFALDDARANDLAVLPHCPFVKGYVQRHPEYVELVPEDLRAEFELGGE